MAILDEIMTRILIWVKAVEVLITRYIDRMNRVHNSGEIIISK